MPGDGAPVPAEDPPAGDDPQASPPHPADEPTETGDTGEDLVDSEDTETDDDDPDDDADDTPPASDATPALVTLTEPCRHCYPRGWPSRVDGAHVSCHHGLSMRYGQGVAVTADEAARYGVTVE